MRREEKVGENSLDIFLAEGWMPFYRWDPMTEN